MEELIIKKIVRNKKIRRLYLISKIRKINKRYFNFDKYEEDEYYKYFRFDKTDILTLINLLRIPDKISTKQFSCSSKLAICILLRRLSYPNRLIDLQKFFKINSRTIGNIFNFILGYVYRNFCHLLRDFNQPWLQLNSLLNYCRAVYSKGGPLNNCWGFIDGTVRPICRPIKFQKRCYNGHKRVHALKYQSLIAPNGLIINLSLPIEGSRHDAYILSQTNYLSTMTQRMPDGTPLCIYGDPAYPLRTNLIVPFRTGRLTEDQIEFNKRMSSVRVSVEWAFGKVVSLFSFVDFKKNQKLLLQPVGNHFAVAVLLTNFHTCFYGSQTSRFFMVDPPSIYDYLA